MDSSSINPVKGPDIQTAKPSAPSAQPVASPPKAEVQAAPKDTVSLSPAAKNALESSAPEVAREASPENVVQQTDRPKAKSGDAGLENSRQLSVTDANDVVLKIVDNKTREVIKQIPSEEELQLKTAIRNGVENIAPKNNSTEDLI